MGGRTSLLLVCALPTFNPLSLLLLNADELMLLLLARFSNTTSLIEHILDMEINHY